MAIAPREIPTILAERIEAAHPKPAHFDSRETDQWPTGVLAHLLGQGILAEADRAEAITCPGCELQCRKHVEVRTAGNGVRAYILCDEEPDYGRVSITLHSLQRYETNLRRLGQFVARMLNIGPPKVSRNLAVYSLGIVNGRHGKRAVYIAVENGLLMLGVGEQREPIARCIAWGPSGLTIAKPHVVRLSDRKDNTSTVRQGRVPDRSGQAKRKNETLKRDRAIYREAKKWCGQGRTTWSAAARDIVGTELAGELTFERIRRIIFEQRGLERKNSRSNSNSRK